jgi:NAD-dependent deacetylase
LELHGNIIRLKSFEDEAAAFDGDYDPVICPVCDAFADPNELDPYASKGDLAAIQLVAGAVPTCPCCKALQRPDVVWFGEHLPVDVLTDAIAAIAACDAMFVVGTSMQVQPAASMPFLALEKGAVLIEVNPEPCLAEYADAVFDGTAAEVLPKLIQQVWQL